jgi:hypothetical protein
MVIDRLVPKWGFHSDFNRFEEGISKSWPRGSDSYLSVSVVLVRLKLDYNGYGELVFKSGEGA